MAMPKSPIIARYQNPAHLPPLTRQADIFSSSIVAVGAFNPAIFTPDWLERNNLIGKDDLDGARKGESLIVSRQVCAFETDWFALQVLEEQFSLTSKGPLTPAFADLAIGILSLVPHTPITAVGLNFLGHYRLASTDEYHRVGDVLAPKTIWDGLYPEEHTGLADLTVLIQRTDKSRNPVSGDEKRISIQPSTKVRCGVFFAYNDHHVVASSNDAVTAAEVAADTIVANWEPSWQDANRVFDGVLSQALAG
ncbi:MAG: hypothetical protein NFW16_14570 [Candidatus Accumulibacter sp.]|uniref:hypothetical protein n=1 Tax=Accumulibacter sp. TaxID=2053492 RepID=UPI002583EF24|nr:hypothetical protein [Accumulibacter sp.]MCM8622917.1 hypothetical protein [Accumulibacter sp.]